MVDALHAAGIEVIPSLDLTFTADGVDAHPTTVSLRGLDHAAYYRPNGVLNCGHPAVQDLVATALRRWALDFGVDGFCFLNAENMTQGEAMGGRGALFGGHRFDETSMEKSPQAQPYSSLNLIIYNWN